MKYISVCSGIESATVAWHGLGWEPLLFAEIERFPAAVLARHYPNVPNIGDFTQIGSDDTGDIDLLVGGTPCQSFSVAGLRGGLGDARGNLALEFLRLADRIRPRWVVWENVPGVLSSTSHAAPDLCPPDISLDGDDGPRDGEEVVVADEYESEEDHAFSCFLAGLSELGYGFAYRVLDARHFGVPQRRRRVFVVGHLGDWQPAAAVLFERHSLQGNTPPRRETGQGASYDVAPCIGASGRGFERAGDTRGQDCVIAGTLNANSGGNQVESTYVASSGDIAHCLNAGGMGRLDYETDTLVAQTLTSGGTGNRGWIDPLNSTLVTHALRGEGFDASEDGTGRGTPLVPVAFTAKDYGADCGDLAPTLRAGGHEGSHANGGVMPAVAYSVRLANTASNGCGIQEGPAVAYRTAGDGAVYEEGEKTAPLTTATDPCANLIAFNLRGREGGAMPETSDLASMRAASGGSSRSYVAGMQVRRLTPRECERLQGFPDDYTRISGKTPDGPRYKALGNSMAVPVMRWIGERIAAVERILKGAVMVVATVDRARQSVEMKYREAVAIVKAEYAAPSVCKLDTSLYALTADGKAISGAADSVYEAWIDAAMRIEERKGMQAF